MYLLVTVLILGSTFLVLDDVLLLTSLTVSTLDDLLSTVILTLDFVTVSLGIDLSILLRSEYNLIIVFLIDHIYFYLAYL